MLNCDQPARQNLTLSSGWSCFFRRHWSRSGSSINWPQLSSAPLIFTMNFSRNNLAKRRVTNENVPRYFLHHHSPDHYQNRPMSALRQHMSFSSVQHLMKSRTNQRNNSFDTTPKQMDDHLLRRGSRSTTVLNQPNETGENLMNTTSTVVQHTRGHDLVQATCSRLRLPCETCQHTVHGHHYLYCQHCPLVVHRKELCVTSIPRGCPSDDLGIKGWGEGRQTLKWMDAAEVKLEDVYLSANLALQSNKCYECRRILSKSAGHELEPESDVKGVDGTKEAHSNHQLPKSIGKAVVHKITKVHSHKQTGMKKNDSSHSLNAPTEIRVCHVTGRYYCDNCHWDDQWYIPGSIVLLNDTSKQPVCRSAYLRLRVLWDSAIIKIPKYWHEENEKASEVFAIRSKFSQLLPFTHICTTASAIKEYSELCEPAHLFGNPQYLRMCDVIDVLNDTMAPRLQEHLDKWMAHVKSCE
ncbi:hypothetical protein X801_09927, partial [Opisthorchis viverrini]